MPLGGDTVVFRWKVLEAVGGWDEQCLTEEADIGLRLSAAGERIAVVYHRDWATREETPSTVAALFAMLPVFVLCAVLVRLPVPVAIITWIPLYAVALQALTNAVAARMFAVEFGLRVSLLSLLRVPFTYVPYQLLLGASATRAVVRQLRNQVNWEKPERLGAHRVARSVTVPGLQDAA